MAKSINKYDYYSLSDQDDVWLPDKIQVAVNMLNKKDNSIPQLYGSRSILVNDKLDFLSESISKKKEITLYNTLIQNFIAGHTQVMNRKMIECLLDWRE